MSDRQAPGSKQLPILSTTRAESFPPTKPSSKQHSEPVKSSKNGVPTDWVAVYTSGVVHDQLKDENEWDMCPELEKLGGKEKSKTWSQRNREQMIGMGEKRQVVVDGKSPAMFEKKEVSTGNTIAGKKLRTEDERNTKKGMATKEQSNASVERERSMRLE